MTNMHSKTIEDGDEGNSAFGLPAKTVDQTSGFERGVAEQEAETGKDIRLRPSEEKDIPQESLAARIGKIQQEG